MNAINAINARKRKFEQFIDAIKYEQIQFEPLTFEQIKKLKEADINRVGETLKKCKTVLIGTKLKLTPSHIIKDIRKDLAIIKTIFDEKIDEAKASPAQITEFIQLSAISEPAALSELPAPIIQERIIELHMQLLLHATACNDNACCIQNCKKMKDCLEHGDTCSTDSCKLCIKIKKMLKVHSNRCSIDKCTIKDCHRNIA